MPREYTPEQREAQRARTRQHYQDNKQYYKDKAAKRNRESRDRYNALKESLPCVDCGVYFPYYVTHFDHIGTDKEFNVSRLATGSWEKLQSEISKCELVCANCHAVRTHNRIMGEKV